MPKIIFEINYNIHPEKRDDYLELITELKGDITGNSGKEYSVYENKKLKNNFSEIYLCDSEEEYDSLEDDQSEKAIELTQRLFDEFISGGKVTYTTKIEI